MNGRLIGIGCIHYALDDQQGVGLSAERPLVTLLQSVQHRTKQSGWTAGNNLGLNLVIRDKTRIIHLESPPN